MATIHIDTGSLPLIFLLENKTVLPLEEAVIPFTTVPYQKGKAPNA